MRACPTAPWSGDYLEGKSYAGTEDDGMITMYVRSYSSDEEHAQFCSMLVAVDTLRTLKRLGKL